MNYTWILRLYSFPGKLNLALRKPIRSIISIIMLLKKILTMIFWIRLIRFEIQSMILTIFIDIDLSKILLIVGEHFWIKLLLCVHIFIDFSFFFLDLIYINDTWRYMKIVMRYLFFLSYSKNSKNFAYYDRKKI